jgi:hypothetical protein
MELGDVPDRDITRKFFGLQGRVNLLTEMVSDREAKIDNLDKKLESSKAAKPASAATPVSLRAPPRTARPKDRLFQKPGHWLLA